MPIELIIDTRQSDTGTAKKVVRFFANSKINLKYDSIASTFSVSIYFDPNNQEHAEIAGVSHYHEVIVNYIHANGSAQKLITGYILSQMFVKSAKPELVNIGGYSKTGALEDCDIPTDIPLESIGLSFRNIVEKIIKKFGGSKGIKFIVNNSKGRADVAFKDNSDKVDEDYEKVTGPESKNIKSYLTELATQKNLVLSHTNEGNLLITTANTDSTPLFEIDADKDGSFGIESITMNYNGQALHSEITVVRQADDENLNAAIFTIKNPLCPIVYRPKVEMLKVGNDVTIQEAAQNELCKELKSINFSIVMSKVSFNNKFITPNNTIILKSRANYLYKRTKLFIESVDYEAESDNEKVTLTCVLPWVYNYYALNIDGKRSGPYNIFIDPHKNLPRV
jgi:prophage tail gpP-like protein